MINGIMSPIQYAQEAAAEVALIKQTINKSNINMRFEQIRGYQSARGTFESNPAQHMIIKVYNKANKSRI